MNPYMQNVVDQQSKSAITNFNRQNASRAAQGVQAGAFGGSRQGVVQGMAEEGLSGQLDQIKPKVYKTPTHKQCQRFSLPHKFLTNRLELPKLLGYNLQVVLKLHVFNLHKLVNWLAHKVLALTKPPESKLRKLLKQREHNQASRGNLVVYNRPDQARIQSAQAAELARTQGIDVNEASRIQQAQAAELSRTQGISLDEASRIQQAQAAEAARTQSGIAGELGRVQSAVGSDQAVFSRHKLRNSPVLRVLALTKPHVFNKRKPPRWPVHKVLALTKRHVFSRHKQGNSPVHRVLVLMRRHVFRQGKLVNSLESKPLTLLKWPVCSNRTKLLISLVRVKGSLLSVLVLQALKHLLATVNLVVNLISRTHSYLKLSVVRSSKKASKV
jgi:hypothetical protein